MALHQVVLRFLCDLGKMDGFGVWCYKGIIVDSMKPLETADNRKDKDY